MCEKQTWLGVCFFKVIWAWEKANPLFSLNDTGWIGDCGFNLASSITAKQVSDNAKSISDDIISAFHPQRAVYANVTGLLKQGGLNWAEYCWTAHICISWCQTGDSIVDCWVIIQGAASVLALWNTKCLYLQPNIHLFFLIYFFCAPCLVIHHSSLDAYSESFQWMY